MSAFVDKLLFAARRNESLLCVGLDPDPRLMPDQVSVQDFLRNVIEATEDLVCAYKPNLAFFEAMGVKGWRALEETLRCIPDYVLTIGDGKRGDFPNTARFYAQAMFETWGFDAATVSPFLGRDSVEPFLSYRDKGTFLLCKTSNPGSGDYQDLSVAGADGRFGPLYQRTAEKALEWNEAGNVGLVVGATYPRELAEVRDACPELPILIPGIGPQQGDLETTVRAGVDKNGERAIVNASRQVLYASKGRDFADAARRQAQDLRGGMRGALAARSV